MSPAGLVALGDRGGLAAVLAVAYVACGFGVAFALHRRGAGPSLALGALVCWPLLLPLLRTTPPDPEQGPFAARIATALHDLEQTMADPAADEVVRPDDLEGLVHDLERADQRLALVDRLLAGVPVEPRGDDVARSRQALERARARAATEVEAVLAGIVQLRLQIGLRSLAGNSVPVRERLRDLRARLAAVDDLAALELGSAP